MKDTSESLLAFAESELVHKEAIRAAVLQEKPQRRHVAWTRVLLPIAACLILLCGTVLAIPSARAEVQRWFRIQSPEQYLTEDPESRKPNEQIDSLIVSPVTDAPTEAPRTDDAPYGKQVTYVSDEPIWQQIARDFRIDLGDTMFDGEDLYITVTLHGLTALPEIDVITGGNATQVKIPLEELPEYFERGKVPKEYLNGLASFYDDTCGNYYLQFPDGKRVSCGWVTTLAANPDYDVMQNEIFQKYGDNWLTDADREDISAGSIEWLKDRELIGVVRCSMQYGVMTVSAADWHDHPDTYTYEEVDGRTYMSQFADEHGIVSAALFYSTGSDVGGEAKTLLEAEIGTVRFDLGAIDQLERRTLKADTPSVTFGPQQVKLSYGEWIEVDYDDGIAHAFTNLPTDLDGLTLSVENPGYIDALGIHNVQIRLTLPQGWTEQRCRAFVDNCDFDSEISGKQYTASSSRHEAIDDRTRIFTLSFTSIPYDRIDAIEQLRIVPALFYVDEMVVGSIHDGTAKRTPMEDSVRYVHPNTTENVNYNGDRMTLPDGTLTISVQP